MTNDYILKITVNQKPQIIEAKLLDMNHQNGSNIIPPFLEKVSSESNFVEYELREDGSQKHPDSSITIHQCPDEKCSIVTMNLWASGTIFGFVVDGPRKGIIDGPYILGHKKSELCVEFCKMFPPHLQEAGFIIKDTPVTKSKTNHRFEENKWAIDQIVSGRDKDEILSEWLKKRKDAKRDKETLDPKESFRLKELFRKEVWKHAKKLLQQKSL